MSAVTSPAATAPGSLGRLSRAGARAHWPALSATALVLALASTLVTLTGVLFESGLRAPAGTGGPLVTLASSFAGTALVVVVVVVAATATLALRGRRREFALLRAVGATRAQVRRLISTELLLVSAVAVPLGSVPGLLLARWLVPSLRSAGVVGPDFTASLSPLPLLGAVVTVVPTALLASRFAARETVRAAPTAAVRESAVETAPIGPVRRVAAAVTAAAGLVVAGTPIVLPGTIGSALAASSAFLLIGAAALAGPLLVQWTSARVARADRGGAAVRLALANLRGFSRRLTTVVVPLALVVAVGTTQTTVDHALQEASTRQLGAAIGTDLVSSSASGLSSERLAALTAAPGVTGVVPLADAPAEVRTDDDGGLPDSLAWEQTSLRAVPPDVDPTRFDPDVTHGRLAGLGAEDTVAVSSDAAFEIGLGLGDTLAVRLGGEEVALRVVAVYERGLGLGDELIGSRTLAAHGVDPVVHLALVDTSDPTVTVPGTTSTDAYVASATSVDAAAQHLSTLLTLLLLLFVALGSLNALVLITAGRRDELRLLHRSGATGRQLLAMVSVESLVTGLTAWAIGTAAVAPAVFGVTAGLLGTAVPAVDLATYAALSGGVVALAVAATVLTASRTVRSATRAP